MKIGPFHIFLEKRNRTLLILPKRVSDEDRHKIESYLRGGVHIHKNPKKKKEREVQSV